MVGTGEEEEAMLLEALEMQQASSESRQARGLGRNSKKKKCQYTSDSASSESRQARDLGRNSENSVHSDCTGQTYEDIDF